MNWYSFEDLVDTRVCESKLQIGMKVWETNQFLVPKSAFNMLTWFSLATYVRSYMRSYTFMCVSVYLLFLYFVVYHTQEKVENMYSWLAGHGSPTSLLMTWRLHLRPRRLFCYLLMYRQPQCKVNFSRSLVIWWELYCKSGNPESVRWSVCTLAALLIRRIPRMLQRNLFTNDIM